jgi:hypothetical protein
LSGTQRTQEDKIIDLLNKKGECINSGLIAEGLTIILCWSKGPPQTVPQFGCFLVKDKKAASRSRLIASVKPVARPLVSHWRDTQYGDVVIATEIETGDVKSVKSLKGFHFLPLIWTTTGRMRKN